MKKTYKSKVDLKILLPLAVLLGALDVYMLVRLIWLGLVLVNLAIAFLGYLYYFTQYELADDGQKLKISSGFLYHREIYIKSIRKVRPIKNHFASPALSTDRLEIQYNRYGRVLISPEEKSAFLRDLTNLNPRINIG
jgi:Bacterial PH domain